MLQFCWGSSEGNRKIAWIKWSKVCLPNVLGGLGFRDLQLFNQALVAKQAWKIIRDPVSLASRILKGKYFHNCSFLEAEEKEGTSYL